MQSLRVKRSRNTIISALKALPTGSNAYDSTYKMAMERINSQQEEDGELAKLAIMWISCACTPLTSSQLRYAIAVKSTSKTLDDNDLIPTEDIIYVCTGLVAKDEQSGIIRLIHYTAQKYFSRERQNWFPGAHTRIALGCLWYLSLDVLRLDKPVRGNMVMEVIAKHPLLDYAARRWGHHYHESSFDKNQDHTTLDTTAQDLMMNDNLVMLCGHVLAPWPWSYANSPAFKGIHLSSYFGLTNMVHRLLECGHDIEADDSQSHTPLWWATLEVAKIWSSYC